MVTPVLPTATRCATGSRVVATSWAAANRRSFRSLRSRNKGTVTVGRLAFGSPPGPFKNHGYRITRDDAGTWHTYRPDGTEIAPY